MTLFERSVCVIAEINEKENSLYLKVVAATE